MKKDTSITRNLAHERIKIRVPRKEVYLLLLISSVIFLNEIQLKSCSYVKSMSGTGSLTP